MITKLTRRGTYDRKILVLPHASMANWQTCTVTFDQIARLPTTQAVAATDLPRRIGGADALGGQQAVLAHHELGTVGVDRTQDAGFSSQLGNTLPIIAE